VHFRDTQRRVKRFFGTGGSREHERQSVVRLRCNFGREISRRETI